MERGNVRGVGELFITLETRAGGQAVSHHNYDEHKNL
jgi:hypothetical protein